MINTAFRALMRKSAYGALSPLRQAASSPRSHRSGVAGSGTSPHVGERRGRDAVAGAAEQRVVATAGEAPRARVARVLVVVDAGEEHLVAALRLPELGDVPPPGGAERIGAVE